MAVLIVGASGATGSLIVKQALEAGEYVKIIVRSANYLPEQLKQHKRLQITVADFMSMTSSELIAQVKGCHAVISCLGHNLTFKGMFGAPHRLVTNAVQRLCNAIESIDLAASSLETPVPKIKFILMNTTGNQNKQIGERISIPQTLVISLIRILLPPHADNEAAASYLQTQLGEQHKKIEWVVVRPDSLTDDDSVTAYSVFTSPIRSAIFDAGKTSRVNVAHFMYQLSSDQALWHQWKSNMPVIYNN